MRLPRTWQGFVISIMVMVEARHACAQQLHEVSRTPSTATVRPLVAKRRIGPIALDGRLNEKAWESAGVANDFTQQYPDVRAPATQRSEARILVDDGALYVGLRLWDAAPDSIVAPLGRRDMNQYSDWAMVIIDSYFDRRTAFRFMVNPAGVQSDAVLTNDAEWSEDFGWDAVWSAETARDSAGWTAELRIPLSQLRFSVTAKGETRWGIEFGRHLARRNERSYWSPIAPERNAFASQFGVLDAIPVHGAPRRLELVPYSLAQVTHAPREVGNPFLRASARRHTLGADLRAGVTADVTLTATLRPDFGQVEADPSQVNLTGGETFLAERRPFFLDGGSLFAFNLSTTGWLTGQEQLLYTRRMGRAPQLDVPDAAEWSEDAQSTPILGAAKVSGRTRSGWTLGALSTLTDAMHSRYVNSIGEQRTHLAEPMTHYGVARLSHDFENGESAIGGVVTSVHRWPGASSLRSDALVAGLDARRRFANGRYSMSGNVLVSEVRGSTDALLETQAGFGHLYQRPDATYLTIDSTRTSLRGAMSEVRLMKIGSGLQWGLVGKAVSPGFEINDLGIQPRADILQGTGWIGHTSYAPNRFTRNWESWLNFWEATTFGGERQLLGQSVFLRASLRNFWDVNAELRHSHAALDIGALRGGPALRMPERLGAMLRLTSDSRRSIVATMQVDGSRDAETGGGYTLTATPQFSARLGHRTRLQLQPMLSRWSNPQQFVDSSSSASGTRYVVGALRQTSASLTMRADYGFTPRLTLQLYAQPFVSAGEYGSFGEVRRPRSRALNDRRLVFVPQTMHVDGGDVRVDTPTGEISFARPDYRTSELRSNAVLRWEYRPGSAFFLVWSHGRSVDDGIEPFGLTEQARGLLSAPPTNTLLIKVSHWLGR